MCCADLTSRPGFVQTSSRRQADKMQSALDAKPDYDQLRNVQRLKMQEQISLNRTAALKKKKPKKAPMLGGCLLKDALDCARNLARS